MVNNFIEIPDFLTKDMQSQNHDIEPLSTCTTCQSLCETSSQGPCGACENCESVCMVGCMGSCQVSCQDCQTTCEGKCQLSCENACQYACENYCMTECESCETACQGTCLDACQACEGVCQSSCEIYCEDCQTTCQKYCESACQLGCQSGQGDPKLQTPDLNTSATIRTGHTISITINPVSGASTYYARINGGAQQVSSGRTFTFLALLPNTQYLIEIKVSGSGYQDSDWGKNYITTLSAELWEWENPKTQGVGFNVTPEEWLDFCNKINVVRVSKGLSSYPFTTSPTYISKGKDFYAWIWLQAANAINEINGQVANACLSVNSGDEIYAWYFENLKTALNNAISPQTP